VTTNKPDVFGIKQAQDALNNAKGLIATAEEILLFDAKGGTRLIAKARDLLEQVHESSAAMLLALTHDAPIPLHTFGDWYGTQRTYRRWAQDGLKHCYVGNKLCARPSDFFRWVNEKAQPTRTTQEKDK